MLISNSTHLANTSVNIMIDTVANFPTYLSVIQSLTLSEFVPQLTKCASWSNNQDTLKQWWAMQSDLWFLRRLSISIVYPKGGLEEESFRSYREINNIPKSYLMQHILNTKRFTKGVSNNMFIRTKVSWLQLLSRYT